MEFTPIHKVLMQLEDALSHALRTAAAEPGSARAHAQVGALLAALGRPADAQGHLQRALAIDPNMPEALNNMGAARRLTGDLPGALAAFERAVALVPDYVDAVKNLALVLCDVRRWGDAAGLLEQTLARGATDVTLYDALGNARWKADKLDAAIAAYRRATELDPTLADAWGHLAVVLLEAGRIDEAKAAVLEALRRGPERGEFYRLLVEMAPSEMTAERLAALQALAQAQGLGGAEGQADFALGKFYAVRGEKQRSFAHLLSANAAVRATQTYDETATLQAFEDIAATFSASYLRELRGHGSPSQIPIFIVGMPRSGTTLIEQVLAGHPDVYAAGELELFEQIATEMLATGSASVLDIGERYVAEVSKLAPHSVARITDKMPMNFRFVGLIQAALPNARLLHAYRDPLDNCLSCFANSFAAEGMAWTGDLGELGRYYRGYRRLMDHWRAVLPPARMLELRYEEVVNDFEEQARRIIEYCGLPWDDRVLEFYNVKRPVKTASASQVRRPIYRTSVRSAEGYGDLLQPLIDALG